MTNTLFHTTPVKLFLKRDGQMEWTELDGAKGDIRLGELNDGSEPAIENFSANYSLTFQMKPLSRRKLIRLRQTFGLLKAPRCTYRTIKRDCAKRNRH